MTIFPRCKGKADVALTECLLSSVSVRVSGVGGRIAPLQHVFALERFA